MMQDLVSLQKHALSRNAFAGKLGIDNQQSRASNVVKLEEGDALETPVLKYCTSSCGMYAEVNIPNKSVSPDICPTLRTGESGLYRLANAAPPRQERRGSHLGLASAVPQYSGIVQPSIAEVFAYDCSLHALEKTSKMQFERDLFATSPRRNSTGVAPPRLINGMVGKKLQQSPRSQSIYPSSVVKTANYAKWPNTFTNDFVLPGKSGPGKSGVTESYSKIGPVSKLQHTSQHAVDVDKPNVFARSSGTCNTAQPLGGLYDRKDDLVMDPDEVLKVVVASSTDKQSEIPEQSSVGGTAVTKSSFTCDKSTSTAKSPANLYPSTAAISRHINTTLKARIDRGSNEPRYFREKRGSSLSSHDISSVKPVNSIPSRGSRLVLDDSFVVLNSSVSVANKHRQITSRASSAKPSKGPLPRCNNDPSKNTKDSLLQPQQINLGAKKHRSIKSAKGKKLKSAKLTVKSSNDSQAGDVIARAASKLEKICLNSQIGDNRSGITYIKQSVSLSKEEPDNSGKSTLHSRLCGDGADESEINKPWIAEKRQPGSSLQMLELKRLPGDGEEHPASASTTAEANYDMDYEENESIGEDIDEEKVGLEPDSFADNQIDMKDYSEEGVLGSDCNDNASNFDDEGAADDDALSEGASEFSISTCATPVTYNGAEGAVAVVHPPLLKSLFSNCSPVINFVTKNDKVAALPEEQRKLLKWKVCSITPVVVRHTVQRSGFKPSKKSHDWLGCFGKHLKAHGFRSLREYQKINHFPGSFQLGRKDRLWRNISRMQSRFGKKEFGFVPQTYVLPWDRKLLKTAWEEGNSKQKFILKPPASARGIGIHVIHKWSQVPAKRSVLVQKYLSRPYLINGGKFDIRLYVHVTSFDPLRVYLFEDGLVRFATCKYSSSMKHLGNKYMHLTNYSINKKSGDFQQNEDASVCQGHKWSVTALWGYLRQEGVNTDRIWEQMKDIIIKTIISVDHFTNSLIKSNCRRQYCCHELFGFDIMLDDRLRPWVLEVNISPSLHSNSALDVQIKGPMVKDMFNLAGFALPDKKTVQANAPTQSASGSTVSASSSFCHDKRKQSQEVSQDSRAKHTFFAQHFKHADQQELMSALLSVLTVNDIQVLVESEDELARCGQFQRIFPSTNKKYLHYFDQPRYYNVLLHAWEAKHHHNRTKGWTLLESFCRKGLHMPYSQMDPNNIPLENIWNAATFTPHKLHPSPRTDIRLLPAVLKPTYVTSPYTASVTDLTSSKPSVKRARSATRLDPRLSSQLKESQSSTYRSMRPLAILSPVRVHTSAKSN